MAALSAGHVLADLTQSAVPALLPFLIASRGYSIAAASALVLAATIASSVIQPLFGLTADRRSMPWLLPVGLLVGGAGIAVAGVMPSYALTFAAIVVSGVGVAAFHPEGARYATYVSGERRASGMSVFVVGGNVGLALGPLATTPLVVAFGLPGTLFLLIPYAAMAAVLFAALPRLRARERAGAVTVMTATGGDGADAAAGGEPPRPVNQWGPFGRLAVYIAARTFVFFGLVTFVPLWFVDELGTSKGVAGVVLSLMLFGGAVGTLAGGPLADRFGRRAVMIVSMAMLPPLVLAVLVVGAVPAAVLLFAAGAAGICTFSVTVVLGQEYLPTRMGLASGVTLGLSIGLGGVGAALLGLIADGAGLDMTMLVVGLLPLTALLVALTLPEGRRAPLLGGGRWGRRRPGEPRQLA
jgi:FSR family fosmidomycin resistance protein-like MFS transporter